MDLLEIIKRWEEIYSNLISIKRWEEIISKLQKNI